MTTKNVHVKIDEMKTNSGLIKNLELSIGKVINDNYAEPMGPTPINTSHSICPTATPVVFALSANAI